ncbi:hypothetical protein LCGC14_1334480 [marine sediment metagenome]|uniref:C2H2-type domain-containing protein n=1 Tax=marine sediment metagenome TaxID=412755 RepID=A0A0F9KGB0_9ZZZZ
MDDPWKCALCGEGFTEREDWVTHLSMVHGVDEVAIIPPPAEVAPE